MTIQLHLDLRIARLLTLEPNIGAAPKISVYSGAQPADCTAAAAGTKLVEFHLPSDWLATSGASGTINGLPLLSTGLADGVAGHYRLYDTAGTKAWMQGSVSETAGGGDAIIDNVQIRAGNTVELASWSFTEGGA